MAKTIMENETAEMRNGRIRAAIAKVLKARGEAIPDDDVDPGLEGVIPADSRYEFECPHCGGLRDITIPDAPWLHTNDCPVSGKSLLGED